MDPIPFPKHEVLSAQDAESVFDTYKLSDAEMPRIKKGDPALKGLSAKVGDVIKITRSSPTAGEAVYYRMVID